MGVLAMLTGHWTFDVDTVDGRRVADATGSGLAATLDETVGVVPGRDGEALAFDGTGRAVIPAVPQLVLSQVFGFSLAFFLNVTEPPTGEWRGVLYKPVADNDARGIGIWLYPDAMRLRAQLFTAKGPDYADSHSRPATGTWTHVAYVVDVDKLYLYVDGRLDVAAPLEHPVVTATGPIFLGRDPAGTGFAGLLDDFRVYASALTQEAVRTLATPTTPP